MRYSKPLVYYIHTSVGTQKLAKSQFAVKIGQFGPHAMRPVISPLHLRAGQALIMWVHTSTDKVSRVTSYNC